LFRALVLPFGLALALAAGGARADLPPVAARLDYSRGPGGEACPAEPGLLRAQVAARLGYDPFQRSDARERVVVVVSAEKDAWSARVERYDAAGARTFGPETFPDPPLRGECEALISPLAAYLRGMLLSGAPLPSPTAPPPPAPPPTPPALPDVPNPARTLATRVAIASYALTGIFLGLGIAWTVDAQNKENAAESLSAHVHQSGGDHACAPMGSATPQTCAGIVSAFQSASTSKGYRNAWYAGAGISAAAGITSTVFALTLPATIKAPSIPQLSVGPTGVVVHGSF
jgi:hypothetical protein